MQKQARCAECMSVEGLSEWQWARGEETDFGRVSLSEMLHLLFWGSFRLSLQSSVTPLGPLGTCVSGRFSETLTYPGGLSVAEERSFLLL